jgi:hypothetical protein
VAEAKEKLVRAGAYNRPLLSSLRAIFGHRSYSQHPLLSSNGAVSVT